MNEWWHASKLRNPNLFTGTEHEFTLNGQSSQSLQPWYFTPIFIFTFSFKAKYMYNPNEGCLREVPFQCRKKLSRWHNMQRCSIKHGQNVELPALLGAIFLERDVLRDVIENFPLRRCFVHFLHNPSKSGFHNSTISFKWWQWHLFTRAFNNFVPT